MDVIRWGKQQGKQRFRCKYCGIFFTQNRPEQKIRNRFIWFKKWVLERQTYKTLCRDSGYSKDTLQRTFYKILESSPVLKIIKRDHVNLRMDPVAVDNNDKPWVGQTLPSFILNDMNGNLVSSKKLMGKPMIVNLWFTSCGPCIEEMPDLNQLKNQYKDSNVVFLAITFDTKMFVINFLKKHIFNYTIIPGAKFYCDNVTQLYPLTFFVDRKGIIRYAEHVLPSSFDTLNSDLRSILENNF